MSEKKMLVMNKDLFTRRLKRLYKHWKEDTGPLASVECLVVAVGADENSKPYTKSNAFQTWLFSCELLDTLVVLTKEKMYVLASNKKADYFEPVVGEGADGLPSVETIHRNKSDKDEQNFARLVSVIKDADGSYGNFAKDVFGSSFCDGWEKAVSEADIKKNYCSNVSRTMLVQPSKELEDAYESVLVAENALIEALKPGARLGDAYKAAVKALKPEFRDKLYKKELGFATGIEFREAALAITEESTAEVKAGMVFVVSLALSPIGSNDPKKDTRQAAIIISDTILVSAEGPNENLTEKAKSRLKSNVVRYKDEEEEKQDSPKKRNKEADLGRGKRSVVLTDQTRNKTTNEEKRKEHQKELAEQMNEAAKKRMAAQTSGSEQKKLKKSNVSYKSYDKFPKDPEVNKLNIFVDKRHDTVIMPIFGVPVPFHISMIKL